MARTMTNFTAADMRGEPRERRRPAAKPDDTIATDDVAVSAPTAEDVEDDVPDGNVDEITEWVGSDVGRARRALAAEKERKNPRKTLVAQLDEVLEDE